MSRSAYPHGELFDPAAHRAELLPILRAIEALEQVDESSLDAILRRHPRDGKGFFSRAELIAGFRHFASVEGFETAEDAFVRRLLMRPIRTQSGVTPLTVLTKPFACPGRCIFCPNDVRMPKSYLSAEPGAQRAANNRFDPYLQTWNRLEAYHAIGHPTEKIELIVLGGTWSFYPEAYRVGFIAGCFRALNDFGAGRDRRAEAEKKGIDVTGLPRFVDGRSGARGVYNRTLKAWSGSREASGSEPGWEELAALQQQNESAGARQVGLSVETRPDQVSLEEAVCMRRLGVTKVQIGIQSLSDAVLAANARGHDVAATRAALRQLRALGFKIHAHWMPNLLGSTPKDDVLEFDRLFDDPDFRPDELKVYPCSLIESAELMEFYERGEWKPYSHAELLHVVGEALVRAPRWSRLTRVIRDISSDDIVVGNKLTNFREVALAEVLRQGRVPVDIRSREVRGCAIDAQALSLRETEYQTSLGREIFLEQVTTEDKIAAFLRLSLPAPNAKGVPLEIAGSAMIREVHVYGGALDLGERNEAAAQHRGLGRALIEVAALLAAAEGYERLAVISAVGTRAYYRKQGFSDGELYQHRTLEAGAAK